MLLSFDQIREMVINAVRAKEPAEFSCYVQELYGDSIVYCSYGKDSVEKHYQRSYSIVDGAVTLGEATEVKREVSYVPLQAAGCLLSAAGNPESDDFGYTWHVQICKYGPADGRPINWPREPLVAAIPLYEGARVFCLMDTQHVAAKDRPCGKSVREIVGWTENITDSGTALEGDFQILRSAKWLRDMAVDAWARGKKDIFGFSHDVQAKTRKTMVAGKSMVEPVTISAVEIDVVYRPTNEGKLLQMVAASDPKGDENMFEKLLAALQGKRPELYTQITAGIAAGTMTQDAALEQIAAATVTAAGGDATNQTLVAAAVTEFKQLLAATPATGSAELKQMQLIACGMTLTASLTASKLPDAVQNKLRTQFKDNVFTEDNLQAAIKLEKETLDHLTASGAVYGAGDARINVGRESTEKLQAAFDKMLNVTVAADLQTTPGFKSLQAAYAEMTGDSDMTFQPTRRLQAAAFASTTFPQALGNSMHRRIVQDYRATQDYGLSRIVAAASIRSATDFRPLESFVVGYYGDLPTLNTDTADYADLGVVGEEAVEYALMEQGGIIRVTRKMLLNNDLNLVNRILSRIGRGAKRGEARKAWNPLITNAVYKGDGKAIFHVDHGNLTSAAYSVAGALAARTAMAQQTERESAERFPNRPVTVSFPTELFGIVSNVNTYQPQAVTVDNANPMFGYFKPEGLFENSLMTDANDWIMAADPNEVEIVEMAYLNGQREPQMFLANDPSSGGQIFLNGSIQYRISHDYNAEVVDYVGVHKAIVV